MRKHIRNLALHNKIAYGFRDVRLEAASVGGVLEKRKGCLQSICRDVELDKTLPENQGVGAQQRESNCAYHSAWLGEMLPCLPPTLPRLSRARASPPQAGQ